MANTIDSAQLARIKKEFLSRDLNNSELSEQIKLQRENPTVLFDDFSTSSTLGQNTLLGLSYPLELDGKGGLKLSSGTNRIGQQIFEVLDTRIGERVYRPFLGAPELLFETISESLLQQSLKSQILSAIPYLKEENVSVQVYIKESGLCEISVYYSTQGTARSLVKYQFAV